MGECTLYVQAMKEKKNVPSAGEINWAGADVSRECDVTGYTEVSNWSFRHTVTAVNTRLIDLSKKTSKWIKAIFRMGLFSAALMFDLQGFGFRHHIAVFLQTYWSSNENALQSSVLFSTYSPFPSDEKGVEERDRKLSFFWLKIANYYLYITNNDFVHDRREAASWNSLSSIILGWLKCHSVRDTTPAKWLDQLLSMKTPVVTCLRFLFLPVW